MVILQRQSNITERYLTTDFFKDKPSFSCNCQLIFLVCCITSESCYMIMGSLLKGETLKLRGERETITIHWKQGSVAGFGGDRSQTYVLCKYATHNDYSVPIYIQKGYEIKQNFTIDF